MDPYVLGRDLTQTPLATVLTTALKQKVAGVLTIKHAQGENAIFFKLGRPAGTKVMHSFKPFGRMLVELGWISETQYAASVAEMDKGKRQGEALVSIGALHPNKLDEALKLHQLRNLVEIARLKSGQLHFDGAATTAPPWAAEVEPNALKILRAVLAVPESEVVCQTLFDRAGMDAFLVIPAHLIPTKVHFELDAEEEAAARMLESPMTIRQFFIRSHLASEKSRALIGVLLATNLLVSPDRAVPEGEAAPLPKTDDEGRERRRRLRERSFAHFSNTPFGKRPGTGTVPVQVQASAELPDFAEASPAPGGGLTAEERKLKQLIEDKAKSLSTLDAYGKLGINRAATKDQIKAAFVQAAKVFHPDHLPPSLAALAPLQRDVFAAIKEAHDTLMQGGPVAPAPPPPPSPRTQSPSNASTSAGASRAREDEARALAKQGEQALKIRDWAAAAESFHQAHELAPKGDYIACEAWALYSDPARKAAQKHAREMLEAAARTYPDAEKIAQYMGTIARIDGNELEAAKWLRKAASLNPKNGEVASELHLLELRRKKK